MGVAELIEQKLGDVLRAAGVKVSVILQPRADAVARLGFEKIKNGEAVSPEALDASYIRRSDAEIMRSSKTRR